jgi:glutamyl-tRNA synthetase
MIQHFSLERVNNSPASFDPQKLSAFQMRHMQQLPIKQKVALVVPFLQKAGFVASPPPCDTAPLLTKIVEAAGDRLKTAGDILEFDEFFVADAELQYDEKAFEKRVRAEGAAALLKGFRALLADTEPFDHATCEAALRSFIESKEIKIGDIIHALRVAVTGKGVGVGMFEALEILGKDRCLARIDRCLERADSAAS